MPPASGIPLRSWPGMNSPGARSNQREPSNEDRIAIPLDPEDALRAMLKSARCEPCRSLRKRYAHLTPWQGCGEPSGGAWTTATVRASYATTEIGARSDCRPRTLSAALGNECGNPTHDRVARVSLVVSLDPLAPFPPNQVAALDGVDDDTIDRRSARGTVAPRERRRRQDG